MNLPDGWIPVRDGKNLPNVDQLVWYIHDTRNTQTGFFTKQPRVQVRLGWVHEIDEEYGWYITVRDTKDRFWISLPSNADHVLYWQPVQFPALYVEPRPEFEDDTTLYRKDGSYVYETPAAREDIS